METQLQQCPTCGAEIDLMTGECPFCGPAEGEGKAASPPAPAAGASPEPAGVALTDWLEDEESGPSAPPPARPMPPVPPEPRPPAEPVPDIPEAAFFDLDDSSAPLPVSRPAPPRPRASDLPSPVEPRRDVDLLAARTHEKEVQAALVHLAEGRHEQALATLQVVLLDDPAHAEAQKALQKVRLAMLDRHAAEPVPVTAEDAAAPKPGSPERPVAVAPVAPPLELPAAPTRPSPPPVAAAAVVPPPPGPAPPKPVAPTKHSAPAPPAQDTVPASPTARTAGVPAVARPAPEAPAPPEARALERPRATTGTRAPRPAPPASRGAGGEAVGTFVDHGLLPRARPSRAPLALVVGGGLLIVAIVVVVATSGGSRPAPAAPTPPPARTGAPAVPAAPVGRDIPGLDGLPTEIRGIVRTVLEDYAKAMESTNPGHLAAARPDLTRAERDERLGALAGADNVAVELRVVEASEVAPGRLVLVLERTDIVVGGHGGQPATVRETLRLARGEAGWAVQAAE